MGTQIVTVNITFCDGEITSIAGSGDNDAMLQDYLVQRDSILVMSKTGCVVMSASQTGAMLDGQFVTMNALMPVAKDIFESGENKEIVINDKVLR